MKTNRKVMWAALAVGLVVALALPAVAVGAPGYLTQWGSTGAGNGEFNNPYEIAADGLGNVYVADYSNQRVQKFNSTGGYLTQWSTAPDSPEGIRVSRAGTVGVAMWGGDVVQVRTVSGTVLFTVGTGASGSGPGDFVSPESVAFDRFGFIYVADTGNDRIQKFYPNGTFLTQWGTAGTGPGQFDSAYGLDVDALGNVYVADWVNDNVQKFTSSGGYVATWGGSGTADGQFNGPAGINVGQDGNIYVTDALNDRVQAFSPSGGYLFKFGVGGTGAGQFDRPWGVTSDGTGIYVTDLNNDRVEKFTLNSAKQTTRIGGSDRYAVAVNLASTRWPGFVGIRDVIVVCGEDRANADPLASSGLAGVYDAPVLMTKTGSLPSATKNALAQMKAVNGPLAIHVIGGPKSIPTSVFNAIKATNSGGGIERISGADRYELSVNMAIRLKQVADSKGIAVPAVLLFNGQNSSAFYDALAAGPLSAGGQLPMMALRNTSVPGPVSNALATTFAGKPRIVVNSATFVPASLYTAAGATGRLSNSSNRATSAVQIGLWGRIMGWVGLKNIAITNKLPDALTGGSFVGQQGGILLYTDLKTVPTDTSNAVAVVKIGSQQGYVFGGPKSVYDSAIAQFNTTLNTP